MTDDPAAHLAALDDLLARPYPAAETGDATGYGGPGWWVQDLYVSGEFWDDEDGEALQRADEEAAGHFDALARALTARWGEPFTVDLWSYLVASFDGEQPGREAPEPIGLLSGRATALHVWPLPGGGRWLGLAVGQEDKELPVVLSVAVAAGPAPAPVAPPAAG
ncbi:hypothetical protein [Streptomyces rubellomurinus]|uniref:Uncharacterized protein n=1 Tax=Streptomyces rubellomurinus (strain ATCC 31215) TaxID=359131 RepID=A0A0F2TKD3_STRR3|nr:hypothetical protein [Streptomyces rubellomurinus]KJS63723.1 hypothetical protein VM95_00115 [Streptomyces rubellomurinus]